MIEHFIKGIQNPLKASFYLLSYPGAAAASRKFIGTNVFSLDWDLLILLDTCRVDALAAVADEYDFLNQIDQLVSVGGSSAEWIAGTFDRHWKEDIRNTAYLASNGYAYVVLEDSAEIGESTPEELNVALPSQFRWSGTKWDTVDSKSLGRLEHIWKYEPKNVRGELGHIEGDSPPRYVTDRGIDIGRTKNFDRIILHYNQPHSPYVANALAEERKLERYEKFPFRYLKETDDRETVFNAYLDDLRYVLDDVELLLKNIDAEKVVISADHGEAFGEYGVFSHKVGSIHPHIRVVPWATSSATDTGEYTTQFNPPEVPERSVTDTLEALGYKI